MEAIKSRELKHIVANFSFRKKASAYRMDLQSDTNKALCDLIRMKIIEPVDIKGFFVYLRPVKDFLIKLSVNEKQQLGYV
jgi:hypothetical protein